MSNSSVSSGSRRPSSVAGSEFSITSDVSFRSTDCHQGPIVVYCDTCSKPLCSDCLTSLEHRSHKFKTIEEVCEEKMNEMEKQLKDLEDRDQNIILQWVERQKEQLETEFQQLQDIFFTAEYGEHETLLYKSGEKTFALMEALRQGQKKTIFYQTEEGEKYKAEAKNLLTELENLKKKLSTDSKFVCIKEIEDHQKSFDKINEFYTRIPQKTNLDKSRLEALEGSLQRIHGEISEMLPRPWQFYEDVTFNPKNIDKSLRISPNNAQVFMQKKSPKKTYQTEETMVHILANESWKDGRHYWEVDVEKCQSWAVGIVELASGNQLPEKASQRNLGQDKRSWMLESQDGDLAVRYNNHLDIVKEQDVKRLGVFLDMTKNKNQLTFYNVGRNVALHTFYPRFKKNVFPAFSLSNAAHEVQSLVLCNLELKQHTESDSGVDMSSRSSSPMSTFESLNASDYFSDSVSRNIASSPAPEMTTSL